MSGLQYMSGLDVFICIVLLTLLDKWATEAQGKKIWFQLKHLHLSVRSARWQLLSVYTLVTGCGDEQGSEGWLSWTNAGFHFALHPWLLSYTSQISESTATPPEGWAMGLVYGTRPLCCSTFCTHCWQTVLAWWLFEVTFKKAPTESLLEVRQDASVTPSSSFIQGSVLLLTFWICFVAKNGQAANVQIAWLCSVFQKALVLSRQRRSIWRMGQRLRGLVLKMSWGRTEESI